jgi:hypothetical protein
VFTKKPVNFYCSLKDILLVMPRKEIFSFRKKLKTTAIIAEASLKQLKYSENIFKGRACCP